jgi:hypothetical protein
MDASKTVFRTLAASLLSVLLVPASGQDHAKTTGRTAQSAETVNKESPVPWGTMVFSSRDRETIRVYYHNLFLKEGHGAPARSISPELKLNFERDDVLPLQLLRRLTPFPPQLESRLPHLPANYVRGSINADILIVDAHRRRIVDVVHNFLSR